MIQPVTLIEYARTRDTDPGQLLDYFTTHPLPEPQGDRAGQPTYDPDALDRARGFSTLAGFAAFQELPLDDVRRWWDRQPKLWPEPVGTLHTGRSGNPAYLFPLEALEAVAEAEAVRRGREEAPEGLVTLDEFAAEKALNVRTLKFHWRGQEGFPSPAEGLDGRPQKRGRAFLYRRRELLAFVSGRV